MTALEDFAEPWPTERSREKRFPVVLVPQRARSAGSSSFVVASSQRVGSTGRPPLELRFASRAAVPAGPRAAAGPAAEASRGVAREGRRAPVASTLPKRASTLSDAAAVASPQPQRRAWARLERSAAGEEGTPVKVPLDAEVDDMGLNELKLQVRARRHVIDFENVGLADAPQQQKLTRCESRRLTAKLPAEMPALESRVKFPAPEPRAEESCDPPLRMALSRAQAVKAHLQQDSETLASLYPRVDTPGSLLSLQADFDTVPSMGAAPDTAGRERAVSVLVRPYSQDEDVKSVVCPDDEAPAQGAAGELEPGPPVLQPVRLNGGDGAAVECLYAEPGRFRSSPQGTRSAACLPSVRDAGDWTLAMGGLPQAPALGLPCAGAADAPGDVEVDMLLDPPTASRRIAPPPENVACAEAGLIGTSATAVAAAATHAASDLAPEALCEDASGFIASRVPIVLAAAENIEGERDAAQPCSPFAGGAANDHKCPPVQSARVTLHIYDVANSETLRYVNGLFRPMGIGAYHGAVEVYGFEWSYGYNAFGSGVHCGLPGGNDQHRYREAVAMGSTALTAGQVRQLLRAMECAWPGKDYDLLSHNCCHFSDALCQALGVGPAPEWVTNLAGAGATLLSRASSAANIAATGAVQLAHKAAEKVDTMHAMAERAAAHAEDAVTERTLQEDQQSTQPVDAAASGLLSRALAKMGSVAPSTGEAAAGGGSAETATCPPVGQRRILAMPLAPSLAPSMAPSLAPARAAREPAAAAGYTASPTAGPRRGAAGGFVATMTELLGSGPRGCGAPCPQRSLSAGALPAPVASKTVVEKLRAAQQAQTAPLRSKDRPTTPTEGPIPAPALGGDGMRRQNSAPQGWHSARPRGASYGGGFAAKRQPCSPSAPSVGEELSIRGALAPSLAHSCSSPAGDAPAVPERPCCSPPATATKVYRHPLIVV